MIIESLAPMNALVKGFDCFIQIESTQSTNCEIYKFAFDILSELKKKYQLGMVIADASFYKRNRLQERNGFWKKLQIQLFGKLLTGKSEEYSEYNDVGESKLWVIYHLNNNETLHEALKILFHTNNIWFLSSVQLQSDIGKNVYNIPIDEDESYIAAIAYQKSVCLIPIVSKEELYFGFRILGDCSIVDHMRGLLTSHVVSRKINKDTR